MQNKRKLAYLMIGALKHTFEKKAQSIPTLSFLLN